MSKVRQAYESWKADVPSDPRLPAITEWGAFFAGYQANEENFADTFLAYTEDVTLGNVLNFTAITQLRAKACEFKARGK